VINSSYMVVNLILYFLFVCMNEKYKKNASNVKNENMKKKC